MSQEETFVIPRALYSYEMPDNGRNSRNRQFVKKNRPTETPEVSNVTVLDPNNLRAVKRPPPVADTNSSPNNDKDLDFCDSEGALHMIYWQDCLAQASMEIREKIRGAEPCDFEFMKSPIIQYLFTVCIRLRLPNEVRFTAALIFNTYMLRQILSLYTFLQNQTDISPVQKLKEWETIETNAERQIPLRLLSAIQISSKSHSYHDSLSCRQIANCLRSLGFPYTIDAVKSSELRVFKIIEERIPDTPLTICEMAMKVLTFTMNKRGWVEVEMYDSIWQHVLIVLDVCFIHHKLVYDKFLARRPRRDNTQQENDDLILARFKWDFLLLASAVIQTSVLCVVGTADMKNISDVLNRLLNCDAGNVELLRQSIIELIEEKSG